MHTWALICKMTLAPAQCNLETADRWFEVAPERPINVRATIIQLGVFDPQTQYIKIFKYEGSSWNRYLYFLSLRYPRYTVSRKQSCARTPIERRLSTLACLPAETVAVDLIAGASTSKSERAKLPRMLPSVIGGPGLFHLYWPGASPPVAPQLAAPSVHNPAQCAALFPWLAGYAFLPRSCASAQHVRANVWGR